MKLWNEAVERQLIAIVELTLQFRRSKRRRIEEVLRKENQAEQALRVRIVLVIERLGKKEMEMASFC